MFVVQRIYTIVFGHTIQIEIEFIVLLDGHVVGGQMLRGASNQLLHQ